MKGVRRTISIRLMSDNESSGEVMLESRARDQLSKSELNSYAAVDWKESPWFVRNGRNQGRHLTSRNTPNLFIIISVALVFYLEILDSIRFLPRNLNLFLWYLLGKTVPYTC